MTKKKPSVTSFFVPTNQRMLYSLLFAFFATAISLGTLFGSLVQSGTKSVSGTMVGIALISPGLFVSQYANYSLIVMGVVNFVYWFIILGLGEFLLSLRKS